MHIYANLQIKVANEKQTAELFLEKILEIKVDNKRDLLDNP